MGRAIVVLLIGGCGRFGFDAATDAAGIDGAVDGGSDGAGAHDEDEDGVADAVDVCPHVADTNQLDGDGDEVGDACDREPAAANQQWVLFSALTADVADLDRSDGNWMLAEDSWDFLDTADPAQVVFTRDVTDLDVWMGFDIESLGGGGSQAAIVIRETSNDPYWYGEVFDTEAMAFANLMTWDGDSFEAIDSQTLGTTLPLGSYTLHLRVETTGTRPVTSNVDVPGVGLVTTGASTAYTRGDLVLLAFGNMTGTLRWVAFVQSM